MSETATRLKALLRSMRPAEGEVLEKHFLEEKTLASIAKERGVTEGYISQLKNTGLKRIREGRAAPDQPAWSDSVTTPSAQRGRGASA